MSLGEQILLSIFFISGLFVFFIYLRARKEDEEDISTTLFIIFIINSIINVTSIVLTLLNQLWRWW